ncbi:hypothetical protein [Dyadobacter psychrotolerans]|nr:hypothetical protein [Dyadobacter psychrotolerans]
MASLRQNPTQAVLQLSVTGSGIDFYVLRVLLLPMEGKVAPQNPIT